MDFSFKGELKELMQRRGDHCVSIFLPTHRAGREIEQDPIRLGNLLRRAEKELIDRGMRSPNAKDLLAPAYDLMRDGFFARHLADGLSLFISTGLFRYYRAPIHFEERLSIGKRFLFKPFIPVLNSSNRFYVLAISRKSVRLLQCTEFGVNEIELEGVPKSMDEALGYDDTENRPLFRTFAQASNAQGVSMFHGHGGGIESDKEYLFNYFRKLKEGLHPYLREEKAPLIFAGVEYLFPIFKSVGLYQNTVQELIEGNPDELDPLELHGRAMPIAGPYLNRTREEVLRRIADTSCNGQCSFKLDKVLRGAFEGRIDTLLVNAAASRWGTFDPSSGAVEVHDTPSINDEDLIDLATVKTFLNGGTIYPLDPARMPGSSDISALFRY